MRELLHGVILLMVIMSLVTILPSHHIVGEEEEQPLGDIEVINTTENLTDLSRAVKGNITVKDSGVLKIENCTLEFVEDEGNKFHITVENGSTLEIKDSYIYTTPNKVLDPYLKFKVTLLSSTCVVENSTLAFPGWINASHANFTLSNSVLTNVDPSESGLDVDKNDDSPLLYLNNCNMRWVNSRIEHYSEASLEEQVFVSNPRNFTVEPGREVNASFAPSQITMLTDRLSATMLEASYKGEQNYTGTNYLQWRIEGAYKNTTIKPTNATELITETYDLFLHGVDRIRELKNLSVRFVNNDNGSINFTSIRVVFAYNNDITLINSTLWAINTYLDVDFRPADVDPITSGTQETQDETYLEDANLKHNALRLLECSAAYLYNVTVDMSETNNQVPPYGDPVFLADNTSEGFFYRLLEVKSLDGAQHVLANASVVVTHQDGLESVPPEPSWVLSYLGRNVTNYNVTDCKGVALIPLCSDLITATQWRNGNPVGNYTLNVSYSLYSRQRNIKLARFHQITQEDNTPIHTVTFDELKPELSVTLEVSPKNPLEGENVTLNATVYNHGTTNAYEVSVVFYDNSVEIPSGNLIIALIVKEGNVMRKITLTASATHAHEHHNITVKIDPEKEIPELDETNNDDTKSIWIDRKPDLWLEAESILVLHMEGGKKRISVLVRNSGGRPAKNFSVTFWDGKELIGERTIDWLKAGGCENISIEWHILHTGSREINITVDEENTVDEFNEENNQVSTSVDISLDLYATDMYPSNPYPVAGDTIIINSAVYNSGEATAYCDVEFYANDCLIGCDNNLLILANDYAIAKCQFNTTNYGGWIELKIKITNSTPSETGELSNEYTAQLLVYTKPDDLIVEIPTIINWDHIQKGNVIVRKNGNLTILNSIATIRQTADYQFHIILLDSGKLVLKNSVLRSEYKLRLRLYNNSSLCLINSTVHAEIIGAGEVALNIEKSTVTGTLQLVGERINLIDSKLEQTSHISANIVFTNNTNVNAPMVLNGGEITLTNSVFTKLTLVGGMANVTNITKKSILVTGNAQLYTYHLLELKVVDKASTPLRNATVKIYNLVENIVENKSLYLSAHTNKNGKAVLKLLTNITTTYRDRFVGSYRVFVAFENYTTERTFNIQRAMELQVKMDGILIPPGTLLITITPSKEEVKAGEELTISLEVLYKFQNTKAPAPNASFTLTIDGKEYIGKSDAEGKLELEVKAPKEVGAQELKVAVKEEVYGLHATSSETIYVKKLPKKELNLIPIVIGVVCAALVGLICYFKRETIKPRLLVLKAKLRKEELIECSECGKRLPEALERCPYCGAKFEEELVKCSKCGAHIPASAEKCPECGAVFEE